MARRVDGVFRKKVKPAKIGRKLKLGIFFTMELILLSVVGLALLVPSGKALTSGDGILLYGVSANTTPQSRDYNGTANTFSSPANTVAGAVPLATVVRTSPTKLEAIAGYVDSSGVLRVMCYNGTSWSNEWTATVGGTGTTRRFDIAYETNSGDVMVLYSTNATSNELGYRTKPGSSACGGSNWAAAANVAPTQTGGIVHWVTLAWDRRGTSNLIAAAWADAASDLSSVIWSGSAWGNEPTAALSTGIEVASAAQDVDSFDIVYETSSGDIMVGWSALGSGAANLLKYATCTGGTSACTWTLNQNIPTVADAGTSFDLSASPNSDEVAMSAIDNGTGDLSAGYWSGTAWTGFANLDTSTGTPTAGTKMTTTGWLVNGATRRFIITYDDSVGSGLDWYVGTTTATPVAQTDFGTTPSMAGVQARQEIETNPLDQSKLMFIGTDSASDLVAKSLTMSATPAFTWTNADGGAVLTASLSQATLPASYAYWRNIPSTALDQSGYRWFNNVDTGDIRSVQSNPSTGNSDGALAEAIDADGGYLFVGGYDSTAGAGDTQWRIEKRTLGEGSLVTSFGTNGVATTNPSTGEDKVVSLALDTAAGVVYAAGYDTTPGNTQWRIEKRSMYTGALVSGFGTGGVVTANPTTRPDQINSIVIDTAGGNLYAGGFDGGGGANSDEWRIEKRSLATGALVSGFGTGGVITVSTGRGDRVVRLNLDATNGHFYAVGYDAEISASNQQWHIEKRLLTTGATVNAFGTSGVLQINPGTGNDQTDDSAIDITNGHLYLVGNDTSAGGGQWRIEKRNLSDGLTVNTFGTLGVVQRNPGSGADAATNIRLDGSGSLYVLGTDTASGNTGWRYEKLAVATGAAVSGFGTAGVVQVNPSSGTDMPQALVIDAATAAIYASGDDATGSDARWRLERLSTSSGQPGWAGPLTTQNTAASAPVQGTPFRLRLLLHATGNDLTSGSAFKLQVAARAATCASTSSAAYADVSAASGAMRFYDNPVPADAAATLADPRDPTNGSFTVAPQSYEESNNFTNASTIPVGQDGLWDFALVDFSAPASTAYCFRVVNSDNSELTTYSYFPEITSAAATQAPNTPASLAQRKTDDIIITTGGWLNATTAKFTANLSDPDASDTLQLCVEVEALGTAFNNIEDNCGSGVAYSGTAVLGSVQIAGLSESGEYHWQARTRDNAGRYSAWQTYGDNPESARDFGVDTTSPTGGTVYDGTTLGVDQAFSDSALANQLNTLSANWTAVAAGVSGLNFYEYSIGTSAGATDVLTWQNNGTATSKTVGGLTLRTTQVYYFNVRTTDNAGNTAVISSDGQLVLPSLSFSVSASTLNFANLNAGNSFTDTKSATLTTSTNAYGGYQIRTYATGLLTSTDLLDTIPFFTGGTYANPALWSGGQYGFGYTSSDTTIGGSNKFSNATLYAPFNSTSPGDVIADHDSGVTGSVITDEQFSVTYRVTTEGSQRAKNYTTTLVYTATPIY